MLLTVASERPDNHKNVWPRVRRVCLQGPTTSEETAKTQDCEEALLLGVRDWVVPEELPPDEVFSTTTQQVVLSPDEDDTNDKKVVGIFSRVGRTIAEYEFFRAVRDAIRDLVRGGSRTASRTARSEDRRGRPTPRVVFFLGRPLTRSVSELNIHQQGGVPPKDERDLAGRLLQELLEKGDLVPLPIYEERSEDEETSVDSVYRRLAVLHWSHGTGLIII